TLSRLLFGSFGCRICWAILPTWLGRLPRLSLGFAGCLIRSAVTTTPIILRQLLRTLAWRIGAGGQFSRTAGLSCGSSIRLALSTTASHFLLEFSGQPI